MLQSTPAQRQLMLLQINDVHAYLGLVLGKWTDRVPAEGDARLATVVEERREGYVPNSIHQYVVHLQENLPTVGPLKPIATYCGTDFPASIAASILQQQGFTNLINIPGSWTAWQAARLPVDKPIA